MKSLLFGDRKGCDLIALGQMIQLANSQVFGDYGLVDLDRSAARPMPIFTVFLHPGDLIRFTAFAIQVIALDTPLYANQGFIGKIQSFTCAGELWTGNPSRSAIGMSGLKLYVIQVSSHGDLQMLRLP